MLSKLGNWPPTQRSRNLFYTNFKCKHIPIQQTKLFSSLPSVLDLCNKLEFVQQIHARFILRGHHQNPALSSKLIDSYSNLGHLDLSQKVFESVNDPDAVLCNTIIRSCFVRGKYEKSLCFYRQMLLKSIYPDEETYNFLIKSCSDISAVENGLKVHCDVVKLGFESHVPVGTALVEMYVGYGEMGNAQQAIEGMSMRDLSCWNTLISGFCQSGNPVESFGSFKRMREEGVEPNSCTIISLLRSSVDLKCLEAGRSVHLLMVLNELGGDLTINTALLTMYSKLGSLETARLVFNKMTMRDSVVWNIMITAYSRNGYPDKALELLVQMGKSGFRTDLFTAIASISSAAQLKTLKHGRQIHAHVIRNGSDYQISVHNSLIEMYARCGSLESARTVFNLSMNKTVISWSSMTKAYVSNGRPYDALSLFSKMKTDGLSPDSITIINVLPACVHIGALEQVKDIHGYSLKKGLNMVVSLVTALLVAYAKCGCIEMAQKLFNEEGFGDKDIVSWNSMISACAKHGSWSQCFELFNRMKDSKVRPDQITFIGLLTACVNSGLVKEGWKCFNQMTEFYGCQPLQEHYACMVDLLGRTGQLDEAMKLIGTMPCQPDTRVWGPLLSACKMHSETRLAEFAAERLIEMEPKNAGNYVLLSNIYAAAGKWEGVAKMRGSLRDRGLRKIPGCSWLEINGRVHEFRVADRSHAKSGELYSMLRNLELESKVDPAMGLEPLS